MLSREQNVRGTEADLSRIMHDHRWTQNIASVLHVRSTLDAESSDSTGPNLVHPFSSSALVPMFAMLAGCSFGSHTATCNHR